MPDLVARSPRWWYTEGFRKTRYLRVFSFPDIRLLRVDPQDPVWIYLFLQKLAFSCPFTPQTRYPRIQPNKGVAEEEERERAATDDDAKP